MLKNQEKKLVFNVTIISLVLCLLVCITWGITKVSTFEVVMKYIVIPALIIVASIININIKYRNYRPANKFATVASYAPMFSYVSASLFNTLLYLARSLDVYTRTKWMIVSLIIIVVLVAFTALSHLYYRAVLVFNKNTAMLFDYSFLGVVVVDTLILSFIGMDHAKAFLESGSVFHILVPALLGALVLVLHAFILRNYRDYNDEFKLVDKGPLLENWMKIREDMYYNATEEIMNALYDYSASNLEFEDEEAEVEPETVVEVVDSEETLNKLAKAETEKAEALAAKEKAEGEKAEALAAKEKAEAEKAEALAKLAELEKEEEKEPEVVTVTDPALEAEMAKLQEENERHEEEKAKLQEENEKHEEEKARLQEELNKRDEQDRLEAEEAARAAEAAEAARAEKEAAMAAQYKAIRPTYEKMCQYIDEMEGVRNVATSNGNKFYIGKKLVAIFQKGKADYRITFQAKDDKFLAFIKDSTDSVNRATSPKGTNWLKFVNKGVTPDEFVKDILKGAVEYVNDEIAAELAAKEEAKRIKAEEKRKAREAEKAAKAKAAAKEKEKAAKAKEKAKKAA